METETFFQTFMQNGFSVVVAAFLLLRMEKELRLLRGAIETLRHCAACRLSPVGGAAEEREEAGGDARKVV